MLATPPDFDVLIVGAGGHPLTQQPGDEEARGPHALHRAGAAALIARAVPLGRILDALLPVLYAAPVIYLLLIWASRYALSRTYKKVQKDD